MVGYHIDKYSRFCRLDNEVGSAPLRRVLARNTYFNLVNCPNPSGIEPCRYVFPLKSRYSNRDTLSNSLGIVPVIDRSKRVNAVSARNWVGIGPWSAKFGKEIAIILNLKQTIPGHSLSHGEVDGRCTESQDHLEYNGSAPIPVDSTGGIAIIDSNI